MHMHQMHHGDYVVDLQVASILVDDDDVAMLVGTGTRLRSHH